MHEKIYAIISHTLGSETVSYTHLMKLKNKRKFWYGLSILLIVLFFSIVIFFNYSEVQAVSKYGSRGKEVTLIQTKLKRWG